MLANDMLEYRNKIIEAFRDGTFSSEHLKNSDDDAYDYVLKKVTKFIRKIKSMSENINLSLLREFFQFSPVDYAKHLINLKNTKENKEFATEAEIIISDLKRDNKKYEWKSADETLKIIKEIFDYIKKVQIIFSAAPYADKGKSEPKTEESIAERVKLRRKRITETEVEKKTRYVRYGLKTILLIIKIQVICTKNFARQKVQEMRIKYI